MSIAIYPSLIPSNFCCNSSNSLFQFFNTVSIWYCIGYCLQLDKMTYISKNKFETLNWLPVKYRFIQSINSIVFKYFTKQRYSYLNEVFELVCSNNLRTRNSYLKLICPFQKTSMGENTFFFIGPSLILSNTTSKHMTLNRWKINYGVIIITIIGITLLFICLLL